MTNGYILAIDQSTSATKAMFFNEKGELVHRCNASHEQFYPAEGWVEHDAAEIYRSLESAVAQLYEETGVSPASVKAIGLSNQRETVLVWDRKTGEPVYNAIVWQCNRATEICKAIERAGHGELIRRKTGLILSPYFSASKIKWILDNVEGVRERANAGELAFGTIDSWVVWCMTGGKTHATDYSNASRTQLFNLHTNSWDQEIFDLFTIPMSMAPEVKDSNACFGYTSKDSVFGAEIPINGVLGDSHGALFGQNCFESGMTKTTYGTGSSIMMNIGKQIKESKNGLVTSIGWCLNGEVEYVFEGNINCTGDTIRWLAEDLQLISSPKDSEAIAREVSDSGSVYFVPAFVGLSAPYWDSDARATITGMTRGTRKAHVVRAALESITYQITDVLSLMVSEAGIVLNELRVDGGPTKNSLLMQFQSDISRVPVVVSSIEELSATGAAYMAGLSVGIWRSKEEISRLRKVDKRYEPVISQEKRDQLYEGWKQAVRRTRSDI